MSSESWRKFFRGVRMSSRKFLFFPFPSLSFLPPEFWGGPPESAPFQRQLKVIAEVSTNLSLMSGDPPLQYT